MTITIQEYLSFAAQYPPLRIISLLLLGAVFVNGWTDAPNAIASLVATGGMKMREAVRLAALFNFAGLFVMTVLHARVAFTIYHMVDFGGDGEHALVALCAALTAIIVWAAGAWYFGIPTSESHALIAGLSGAAVALQGGFAGINGQEWCKVLYGLFLSTLLGFGAGLVSGKTIKREGNGRKRTGIGRQLHRAQILGAAAMAFMHGAQDGQKFLGVFLLGIFLARGEQLPVSFSIPFWMIFLCSIVMAAGTAVGGERIINKIGKDMVPLKSIQGIAADVIGAGCLLLSSLLGLPVSTTHVKTTAVMGLGMGEDASLVDGDIVKEMLLTWLITFPGCGLIGYLVAKLFMIIT